MSIAWTKEQFSAFSKDIPIVLQAELEKAFTHNVPIEIHVGQRLITSIVRKGSCKNCQHLDKPSNAEPCNSCLDNSSNFQEYLPLLPPDAKKGVSHV